MADPDPIILVATTAANLPDRASERAYLLDVIQELRSAAQLTTHNNAKLAAAAVASKTAVESQLQDTAARAAELDAKRTQIARSLEVANKQAHGLRKVVLAAEAEAARIGGQLAALKNEVSGGYASVDPTHDTGVTAALLAELRRIVDAYTSPRTSKALLLGEIKSAMDAAAAELAPQRGPSVLLKARAAPDHPSCFTWLPFICVLVLVFFLGPRILAPPASPAATDAL